MLKKILIANRGEIARRIARTTRAMNVPTVAVYHSEDVDAPHLQEVDEPIEITGAVPVETYLDGAQIIAAAKDSGADAIHPGYGFLSENADFAQAVVDAGLTFIGPEAETIRLMGDKLAARKFAIKHKIPVAPSVTGSAKSKVFLEKAATIGCPLLIKAAAGGGGKGMEIVSTPEELADAAERTSLAAKRAFGNGKVYAEKMIEGARHVEVQILADGHGTCLHLGERDCSTQRRFQKIIEETPAPCIDEKLRKEICETAVWLAKAAGYQNAGTVEFLLSPDDEFYFLEMNTRLQVEHGVTELVTGIDLVQRQIEIAAGMPLDMTQDEIRMTGHAVECRIYAEVPEEEFRPSTGEILFHSKPRMEGIRLDSDVRQGMSVTPSFDPMIGKLLAWGGDRTVAIERLIEALHGYVLLGVETNINYLIRLLDCDDFRTATLATDLVDQNEGLLRADIPDPPLRDALLAAAAMSERSALRQRDPGTPNLAGKMGGWRN